MKKSIFVLFLLFLVTAITFGQADTTAVSHEATQNAISWLKDQWTEHMWTIIALAFAVVSEWLGNTGKVKEGSIIAWILNLVGKWISKKDVIKTKKADFMKSEELKSVIKKKGFEWKTLTVLILLFVCSLAASAQGILSKPDKNDFIIKSERSATGVDVILPEISKWSLVYGVTATSIDLKTGQVGFLSSTGFGVSRTWYKLTSAGVPYKTLGVAGMMLFGNEENNPLYTEGTQADIGVLGSVSVGAIAIGPTYFFKSNRFLLNLSAQFTF